jgi:hypothetical protein
MKQPLLLFFILLGLTGNAQTVLLEVDRQKDTIPTHFGPNEKRFVNFYYRVAFLLPPDEPGARIVYGSSVNIGLGLRTKSKIGNVYSNGWEFGIQYSDYKLKQQETRQVPDSLINNMARYDYLSAFLGFYNRFNFDPNRGNYLGHFLDIGVTGEWNFSIKYITKNDGPDGTLVKTVTHKLNYTNVLNLQPYVRVGLSHISVFGSYRVFDLWKESSDFPDMPRFTAGIDLAIF